MACDDLMQDLGSESVVKLSLISRLVEEMVECKPLRVVSRLCAVQVLESKRILMQRPESHDGLGAVGGLDAYGDGHT